MLLFHLFTFDPGWLRAKSLEGTKVFYDGTCALCHGSIRFLLSEETAGALRFATIQSELFKRTLTDEERASLPDTFVTVLPDGTVLMEADGVIHLFDALGGLWRMVALAIKAIPRPIRNWGYHIIGDRRFAIFGTKKDLCPLMPPKLRSRFLD